MHIRLTVSETMLCGELLDRRESRLCQLSLPKSDTYLEDVPIQVRMLMSMGNITVDMLRGVQVLGAEQQRNEIQSVLKKLGISVIR